VREEKSAARFTEGLIGSMMFIKDRAKGVGNVGSNSGGADVGGGDGSDVDTECGSIYCKSHHKKDKQRNKAKRSLEIISSSENMYRG
jgi:hypothetical protein